MERLITINNQAWQEKLASATHPHQENLDGKSGLTSEVADTFVNSAARCHELGWRMAMVDAEELVDLEVNFADGPEVWTRRLAALESFGGRLGLGVYTGTASNLLILEVQPGVGDAMLDRYGEWRSPCRTRVASGREQHYYSLPSNGPTIPTCYLAPSQVMVFGENGLVLVPPSKDIQTQEVWGWLAPPWECPPPEAPTAVRAYLEDHLPQLPEEGDKEPEVLSWDDVYRLITPHPELLKALLAPSPSLEQYYHELLQAALDEGLRDQALILGLFWHAPRGDINQRTKCWGKLKRQVAEALAAFPGNGRGKTRETKTAVAAPPQALQPDELPSVSGTGTSWDSSLTPTGNSTEANPPPAASAWGNIPQALAACVSSLATEHPEHLPTGPLGVPLQQSQPTATPATLSAPLGKGDEEIRFSWSELPQKVANVKSPQVIQDTMHACIEQNPDLSGDPFKVQMVHYCFKNYVNIDPELSELTLQEQIERATQMAREFLGI